MHIVYKDKDIKKTCNDINEAKKRYPAKIARKLIKAINFIKSADSLQDVIQYPPFHFHDLKGKRKGQYAIDIDGRRSSYRLILKPIDENLTDIYANAKSVEIIMVWEVSKHYE